MERERPKLTLLVTTHGTLSRPQFPLSYVGGDDTCPVWPLEAVLSMFSVINTLDAIMITGPQFYLQLRSSGTQEAYTF